LIKRPVGIILLACIFLAAGLAGLPALWLSWPRTSGTSPLAALFASLWSCTHLTAAFLTWHRSRLAAAADVAAIGLLLFPASFLFPGGQLLLPSFAVVVLAAFAVYLYLRRAGGASA